MTIGGGDRQPALVRPAPAVVPPVYVVVNPNPAARWPPRPRMCSSSTAARSVTSWMSSTSCAPVPATASRCGSGCRRSSSPGHRGEALANCGTCSRWWTPNGDRRSPAAPDPRQMYRVLADTSQVGSNGGTLAGLVGSHEQVAERIAVFHDAGIELFMLSFQPLESSCTRFADNHPRFPLMVRSFHDRSRSQVDSLSVSSTWPRSPASSTNSGPAIPLPNVTGCCSTTRSARCGRPGAQHPGPHPLRWPGGRSAMS